MPRGCGVGHQRGAFMHVRLSRHLIDSEVVSHLLLGANLHDEL